MKIGKVPCFLIFCFVALLLLKVSGATSFFVSKSLEIEINSTTDESAEKEEKKIETEYLTSKFLNFEQFNTTIQTSKKIIIPNYFNIPSYFPEVLTPPPLV